MLYWVKQTVFRQLCLLLGANALALLFFYSTRFQPRSRFDLQSILEGFAAGAAIFALISLADICVKAVLARRILAWGIDLDRAPLPDDWTGKLGLAVTSAASEEPLLRGFVFAWLMRSSAALALLVNCILVALLYFRGRSSLWQTLLKTIEGSLYAILYWNNRSLMMVIAARFSLNVYRSLFSIEPESRKLAS